MHVYQVYCINLISPRRQKAGKIPRVGKDEGKDVKSCFSEYPYRYLEQNKKHQPKLICPLEIISRPMLLSHEMLVVIGKLYKTGQEGM
jgi:hypothetical protein